MPLGPRIRRLFGRHERRITEAYRSLYIDLDRFVMRIQAWAPGPRTILEVGCGEGALTERLVTTYPTATIIASDITPAVGRLFRGPKNRVTFVQERVERIAANAAKSFDLVVLSDVLHHVPPGERHSMLLAIDKAMTPEGSLVFKDWAPSGHLIHWLCSLSDRYLTGDDIRFCAKADMAALLGEVFGPDAIRDEAVIRPWANNVAFLVRRGPGDGQRSAQ